LRGTIRFDGDGLVATERSRHVRFARVPGTPRPAVTATLDLRGPAAGSQSVFSVRA